ncbi:Asp-tRNA(Asn)/Glu-tRNA(Gln) amidotransferase subunit GatB [Blastopirellula marina]|uniref:Aspartyl/glutamyl-tRNA(Asn/Gln) amidotransferase subunit B n=1 Tax=Blastopirellula marina DSM 3645 TaxID=314230 RepID=A3ZPT5_9BACT|nr:Asp-tRNA(Asn)/Glu-tRNA(Gln) amidotransferase subunit GatB [Blastopirellula marina]EAQ81208.1 aspartyl/glutamyl-tRNA amidotransferase subunit B [Blastopirellula marina DSM 3645]
MSESLYEIVIGLEVHVQLATQTKLFCRCSTQYGAPPNTQTCPVCLAMPGSLPVMNRTAFQLGLKTACALNLQIPNFTKWDRKNYYYPDLPKGYQISQYDLPMSQDGFLLITDPKGQFEPRKVGIIRAHLEEDAGKSMHDEAAGKADSRIDLNRTGTPLLEIVSEPDMRSPLEAKAYLTELKLILEYLGVSDCNMQEGSLRVDANVNLHLQTPEGKVATPIVEIKNMNSFRAVERAIAFEAERQYEVWLETKQKIGDVAKQTRGWDDQAQVTRAQRYKEESSDYRYFPEPDLAPVTTTDEEIAAVKAELGELPRQIRDRLEAQYKIPAYDADVIVNQGQTTVNYYETLAKNSGDGKLASNWVQQEVLRVLKERSLEIDAFPISTERLAELVKAVAGKEIDGTRAKDVFAEMLDSGKSAPEVMKEMGIEKVDDSELENLCRELLEANPKVLADLKEGTHKAVGALIGQAKKKNPNIDPGTFRQMCIDMSAKM